jgi:hypothetical protein
MSWHIEAKVDSFPDALLAQHAYAVINRGPTRILIDASGEACPPRAAMEKGAVCDIILIRKDGWSLGTCADWFEKAYEMWKTEWVAVLTKEITLQRGVTISCGKIGPVLQYLTKGS